MDNPVADCIRQKWDGQLLRPSQKGLVFKSAIYDERDQMVGYTDETEQVDSVIIYISQVPRGKLVRTTDGLKTAKNCVLIVYEHYMTTRPGVFAAGDVVTSAKTVVHAVDGAKKAVEAMIRYMEAH